MNWRKVGAGPVNPSLKMEKAGESLFSIDARYPEGVAAAPMEKLTANRFIALPVKPGKYAPGQYVLGLDINVIHNTWPEAWSIDLRAGEIVYVGNFKFEAPMTEVWGMIWPDVSKTTVRFAGLDEVGARNYLSTFKYVNGPLKVRQARLQTYEMVAAVDAQNR